MPGIYLSVLPVFVDGAVLAEGRDPERVTVAGSGISVGTIDLIRLIRERMGIRLAVAKAYVDRAVFDGETVFLSVESQPAAVELARAISELVSPATFLVRVAESDHTVDDYET